MQLPCCRGLTECRYRAWRVGVGGPINSQPGFWRSRIRLQRSLGVVGDILAFIVFPKSRRPRAVVQNWPTAIQPSGFLKAGCE